MSEPEKPRKITLKTSLLSALLVALVRGICASLRLKETGRDALESLLAEGKGAILVTWHGRTMISLWRMQKRGLWALISLSRDGDLQCENFRRFGYNIVRGSTGRRGAAAAREILKALEAGGVLAFTPDGPRGPARKVQEGAIYFARKSGRPIVPVGAAATPRWEMKSWDSYLVPRPFARARLVWGEPIFIGAEESVEEGCLRVEAALNAVQAAAEEALAAPRT